MCVYFCDSLISISPLLSPSYYLCLQFNLSHRTNGLDPNPRDDTNRTPLHWAAAIGNANLVQLLIKHGADDSLLDSNGATPLHYAAQHGRIDCITALLSGKQKSDAPDHDGRRALTWAVMKGSVEACEALLKGGVSPDKQDNMGRTGNCSTAPLVGSICFYCSLYRFLSLRPFYTYIYI